MVKTRHLVPLALIVGLLSISSLLPGPVSAAEFPPISDQAKKMTVVPGQPGAAAVILFKDAELHFRDYPSDAASRLDVRVRIKILTEEGLEYGEIEIPHSRQVRLDVLKGRTVTPDGKVLELPKDSIFREVASKSEKIFVTKAAFPGLEVGSIIDYRYTIYWDDFFFLEPWVFHDDLPVISSTIEYHKPDNLGFQTWGRETGSQKFTVDQKKMRGKTVITVSMGNLAALPDEPASFPRRDLSSRFMVIPTVIMIQGNQIPLLDSWKSLYSNAGDGYKSFLKKRKALKGQVQSLTSGAAGKREKAEAVYRWLRDEIALVGYRNIWVDEQRSIKDAVEGKAATMAEKALMLEAMLGHIGIESERLWIADRFEGRIDARVANPEWFEGMILRAEIDGETVYLDPSRRTLAFGALPSHFEETVVVKLDKKEPEAQLTPVSVSASHQRLAKMDLAIDEDGKTSGTGSLTLTGHQARFYMHWQETDEATVKAWTDKLSDEFSGWEIRAVEVEELVNESRMEVRWKQEQREEDVLGDEVSLLPARPLEMDQPFTLPPEKRRSPVQMAFNKVDEVQLSVTWPEGWTVESIPESLAYKNEGIGRLQVEVDADLSARKLTYHKVLERTRTEFINNDDYKLVRGFYDKAATSDAQEAVWILE